MGEVLDVRHRVVVVRNRDRSVRDRSQERLLSASAANLVDVLRAGPTKDREPTSPALTDARPACSLYL